MADTLMAFNCRTQAGGLMENLKRKEVAEQSYWRERITLLMGLLPIERLEGGRTVMAWEG